MNKECSISMIEHVHSHTHTHTHTYIYKTEKNLTIWRKIEYTQSMVFCNRQFLAYASCYNDCIAKKLTVIKCH